MEIPNFNFGTIIEHAWTVAVGLGIYFFRKNEARMDKIEQNHRDLESTVTQQAFNMVKNYTTRTELKDSIDKLEETQRDGLDNLSHQFTIFREDFKDFTDRFIDYISKNK